LNLLEYTDRKPDKKTDKKEETWNNAFESGSYNLASPDDYVSNFVKTLPDGKTALDLGCGLGRHIPVLRNKFGLTIGIDISDKAILSSRNIISHSSSNSSFHSSSYSSVASLVKGNMLTVPFRDNSFDLILAWRVIHIGKSSECRQTIDELYRLIKPGGKLLASIRSAKNTLCHLGERNGEKLEERTFRLNEEGIAGAVYHFFDEKDVTDYFSRFKINLLKETELEHTSYTESATEFKNMFFIIEAEKK